MVSCQPYLANLADGILSKSDLCTDKYPPPSSAMFTSSSQHALWVCVCVCVWEVGGCMALVFGCMWCVGACGVWVHVVRGVWCGSILLSKTLRSRNTEEP